MQDAYPIRRLIAVAFVLMVAPASTAAQQATPASERRAVAPRAVIDSLLGQIQVALILCPLQITTATMEHQLASMRGEASDPAVVVRRMYACTDSLAPRVDSLYERARRVPLNPSATGMLRDIVATWRATIPELLPKPSEQIGQGSGRRLYEARTSALESEFRLRRERLKLEM